LPSKNRIATAWDVTIVEHSEDKEEFDKEPEYIAQWESEDDDNNNDSTPVKPRKAAKQYNNVEEISEVILKDLGATQEEEDAQFLTPPTSCQASVEPSQPTGEPASTTAI